MQPQFLTLADIQRQFPGLRPSRLDYLVRERLVECKRNGHGRPRHYPLEALDQIREYLKQTNTTLDGGEDRAELSCAG